MALAVDEDRAVISADTDFGELLARSDATGPSVLMLRRQPTHRASAVAALILANLDLVSDDLRPVRWSFSMATAYASGDFPWAVPDRAERVA